MLNALEGARQDFAKSAGYYDDDDDDNDDFNYDQEVDLTAFEFNEDGHDWRPADSPQLPLRSVRFASRELQRAGNLEYHHLYKKLFRTNGHLPRPARLTVLCSIVYFVILEY